MSAVRKHASFNDFIIVKQERKELKEEEKRLERMQVRVVKGRKHSRPAGYFSDYEMTAINNFPYDFAELELRVAAYYAQAK